MNGVGTKATLAKNLNYYISRSGRTQKEMAEILGVKYSTFNDWCNPAVRVYPRIDKIEMLANYFGILKSDLIEDKTGEDGTDLSPTKRRLIDLAQNCSEDEAERLLQMMQLVLNK